MAVLIRRDCRVLCAAMHDAEPGDVYVDDNVSYHLSAVAHVLVSEPMHLPEGVGRGGHAKHGQWWWATDVPDDVVVDRWWED